MLAELGGERILKVGTGDELCGQEQSFADWATTAFEEACDVFCLSDELNLKEVMKTATLKPLLWSKDNVKLKPFSGTVRPDICKCESLFVQHINTSIRLTFIEFKLECLVKLEWFTNIKCLGHYVHDRILFIINVWRTNVSK